MVARAHVNNVIPAITVAGKKWAVISSIKHRVHQPPGPEELVLLAIFFFKCVIIREMFRAQGGIDRLLDMVALDESGSAKIPLSKEDLQKIEDTNLLLLGEKLELLLVSFGDKLTTEVYGYIKYCFNPKEQKEVALKKDVQALEKFLVSLPFPFYLDRIVKKDRQSGIEREYQWFQVSVNERVSYFMKKYADTLTEIECGLLYGFPASSIRAFAGLVERGIPQYATPAEYFFGGIPSNDFYKKERKHYQQWWDKIARISPKLIAEAEQKYEQYLKSKNR